MWVRGLKLCLYHTLKQKKTVAPYVGAWIETIYCSKYAVKQVVAPYVGAWIETLNTPPCCFDVRVAPYVGAWIETAPIR